jgi:hypothetical protein
MQQIAGAAMSPTRLYFTGGATAVLMGWRLSTIDVDIKLVPDSGGPLRELPRLKESLSINIELAAPLDFIPVPPGWEERSPFIDSIGRMSFHHFDLVAQAVAKIERGHDLDHRDVAEMIDRGLVTPAHLLEYLQAIEPELFRYPALDPPAFRRAVLAAAARGDPN